MKHAFVLAAACLSMMGCAARHRDVQAMPVVDSKCVRNVRCDGQWKLVRGEGDDKLYCAGQLRADLLCVPAK